MNKKRNLSFGGSPEQNSEDQEKKEVVIKKE